MKVETKSTYLLDEESSFGVYARQNIRDTVSMLSTDLSGASIIDRRVLGAVARDGAFTSEQWARFVQVINRAIDERKERHALSVDGKKNRFAAAVLDQLSGVERRWLELRQQVAVEMRDAAPVSLTGLHEPTKAEMLRDAEMESVPPRVHQAHGSPAPRYQHRGRCG